MMRSNGFALFRGRGAYARAKRAGSRVKRLSKETLVLGADESPLGGVLLAYALDGGRRFPVVHGFAERPDTGGMPDGEYAMLDETKGDVHAFRDWLGTRPLYFDGTGSIASDHRILGGEVTLVPQGYVWRPEGMTVGIGTVGATLRSSPEEASAQLAALLERSVERRVRGRKKVAVSFSGGLDSSLVAFLAAKRCQVVLCCAFSKGSRDEAYARLAARTLGLEYAGREVDRDIASKTLRGLDLPFDASVMDKALWCLYATTSMMASENGADVMLLGQLADELFGGYMKYAAAAKTDSLLASRMMEQDVVECGSRAFIRDELACSRWVEPRFPFADSQVAELALRMPVEFKIGQGERKRVLRLAATGLGLPEELAAAPKKAAQYSTGLSKIVQSL